MYLVKQVIILKITNKMVTAEQIRNIQTEYNKIISW